MSTIHCPECGAQCGDATPCDSIDCTARMVKILSIDAWRDENSWTWNDWHTVGACHLRVADMKPRQLFAFLRDEGYLSDKSKGKVCMEDDGYNITIHARGTHQPLLAIEYGAHQ